ncbi:hypothetical protein CSQ90_22140 [Janthinobacterium sp. BJB303]|nr:hypothetical protein CSQ90_22140 [Janthinobacterium sp. BJB303]
MDDQTSYTASLNTVSKDEKDHTPVGRMTLIEVDTALIEQEKKIKSSADTIKTKLAANSPIPTAVMRELSRGNSQKARLVMRRIALLVEHGEPSASELIEKLLKIKISKN